MKAISDLLVVCAIVRKDGKILLCRRAPGRREAGLWEFPGGKVETGESLAQALVRELREELGLECAVGEVFAENLHPYAHGSIRLVALEATWLNGALELRDHDQFAWVNAGELLHYGLAPADVPIAKLLCG